MIPKKYKSIKCGCLHPLGRPSSKFYIRLVCFSPLSITHSFVDGLQLLAYLHDYSLLARSMGHKHYGVWHNETLTFPEGEWFDVRRLFCPRFPILIRRLW